MVLQTALPVMDTIIILDTAADVYVHVVTWLEMIKAHANPVSNETFALNVTHLTFTYYVAIERENASQEKVCECTDMGLV